MVRKVIVVASLFAGVALLLLGATWKHWHSPKMWWTKEQAEEYSEAARLLKFSATNHHLPGDPKNDPKLAAAQERFDAIQAKLNRATMINDHTGTVMAILGAAVTGVSAWLLWSRTQHSSNPN